MQPTKRYEHLLVGNAAWIEERRRQDPAFFTRLAEGQSPRFVYIGCSDSRVPPNEITGTGPGELFVSRNIANVVHDDDRAVACVLEYAIEALGVDDIIVSGHHGCGGVRGALEGTRSEMLDEWLAPVRRIAKANGADLDAIGSIDERVNRLAELNAIEQARRVFASPVVTRARRAGRPIAVHGWVIELGTGRLRELIALGASGDAVPVGA